MMTPLPSSGRLLRSAISAVVLSCPMLTPAVEAAAQPPLMLAQIYESDSIDLAAYWVSEKYDGVRAYWDGRTLTSRSGRPIAAPAWFTRGWPNAPLDGELWIDRGRFEALLSVVRDSVPDETGWRLVKYMVFDLPAHAGPFDERKRALSSMVARTDSTTLRAVEHWRVEDEERLHRDLEAIVARGGEGLVLRRDSGMYVPGRSDDLLKLKPYLDAEAEVIGYVPGSGKFVNMLGALEVRTPEGTVFRIGTGFTDEQRARPPAIGSRITYRYHGVTANGVPRFASFLRERNEDEPHHSQRSATREWQR